MTCLAKRAGRPYLYISGPVHKEDIAQSIAQRDRTTKWLDTELAAESQTGAIGETGLYYLGHRYYSPNLGRWLNRDPIGENDGVNLYSFVMNNAMNASDPDGRIVIGIGGLIPFSGRTYLDRMGKDIKARVNAWGSASPGCAGVHRTCSKAGGRI